MELFRIMENYKIEVKEDLLLLYKTIFFVEAVVLKLEPEYNIWDTIKPWMEKWKDRNLSVKAEIKRKIISFIECLANFYKL
jgi:predicted unusual protein kinase regulating ubiquinone biosynthesis (AarF/ABC1/UbiB family)